MENLISSDESIDEPPRKRGKTVKMSKIKSQSEIMLGEISLLTSDEDDAPRQRTQKKKLKKASLPQKILSTIDLLTSDEEDADSRINQKVPVRGKTKRKLNKDTNNTVKTKKRKTVNQKKTSEEQPDTALNSSNVEGTTSGTQSDNLSRSSESDGNLKPFWNESELLASKTQIDDEIARNLVKLWQEGNTIPFIARYRKNAIGNMTPEALRTAKEDYDEICLLKKKICRAVKTVADSGKLDEKLQGTICSARTLEELDLICAPFKSDSKGSTLAERAKKCGLEEPALRLLNTTRQVNVAEYVDPTVKDIKTCQDVEKGIVHILASEIATDPELLACMREWRLKTPFTLRTKKRNKKAKSDETIIINNNTKKLDLTKKDGDESKFETYFDYIQRVDYLKPHQVLAINRGEALKFLTVKVEISPLIQSEFKEFCVKKWVNVAESDDNRRRILYSAIDDAYQRLIIPLITREIRAELKQKAEKESCKVFSDNLKHLLLIAPLKGKAILGIDPGFKNGCKLALISPTGSLLAHDVVYPHCNRKTNRGEDVIKNMLVEHNCSLLAIGNGTACRETEEWISQLIEKRFFDNLDVRYTIVNEDGASIYSCSPEANKEFGNLDPNIISAVSLARRIQDPMAELVKVEPSHLGIGMYQLDIKKKQLEDVLNEVVSECVSFVGVDLNTASQCLLKRVAGLSDKKATQIIDYRQRHGPFTYRKEMLKIYGIGEKVFEQCAGFLRIGPTDSEDTDFYKKKFRTPLDATTIHPESYLIVRTLLQLTDLKEADIGQDHFIRQFVEKSSTYSMDQLAHTCKTDVSTMHLIFDALSKKLNYDLRSEVNETPLFKKNVTTIDELKLGTVLTGRVNNVTPFGAFVDIGVGRNGLVHRSKMNGQTLHLGNVVEVKVINVSISKGHIQLELVVDSPAAKTEVSIKNEVSCLRDLKVGLKLTGRAARIASFGVFVDVGIGQNGLAFFNNRINRNVVQGELLEVSVVKIDLRKEQFELDVLKIINSV